MTRLAKYSQELYYGLEAETGVATGMRRNGSMTVALTEARHEELRRQAAMARAFDVEVEEISPGEIKAKYDHLNTDDVLGGVYLAKDGQGDPANIALALAKGARKNGAMIREGVTVTGIARDGRRVTGVDWQAEDGATGQITADHVVNCGGMWGARIGRMADVTVPLHACEHFYIVTEAIPNLTALPVLRVPDECAYYKEDAGKLLLGAFEPNAPNPGRMDGISERTSSSTSFPPISTISSRSSQRAVEPYAHARPKPASIPSSTGPKASRPTTPITSASQPDMR